MAEYESLPSTATLRPSRFRVQIPESQVQEFKTMLHHSKLGPRTRENQDTTGKYGISLKWLTDAKNYWENKYDWRATESYINSFTNYEVALTDDDGSKCTIHFTGLFSQNSEAIPIIMMHGWPGSFIEYFKILQRLRGKYSAVDLPYHIIVPSLPGYAFSAGPPLNTEWAIEDIARLMHKLMVGLGFEDGYVAHGGDLGSMISRVMAAQYDSCKAMHINFCIMPQPEGIAPDSITKQEADCLARAAEFSDTGNAYGRMHGTKPATIGLVLSSNPVALLAWIGEKYLAWTDVDPSLDAILESVTLYWFTQTFPRAIYPYAQFYGNITRKSSIHPDPKYHCPKPFGYSFFPKEIAPIPVSWVRTTGNLIWSRSHTEGGHFAAIEKPDILLQDLEDFMQELK